MVKMNLPIHKSLSLEDIWPILSDMRSDVLFLLRSDEQFGPEQGRAYVSLLANFALLGLDLEGEEDNDASTT